MAKKKKRPAKRSAGKKKAIRKPVRKPAKKPVRKKTPAKKKPMPKAQQPIGKVTHYFPHVQAGVVKVLKGPLSVGDTITVKGHTTNFTQKIESMQIDHVPITVAQKGAEIGLKVTSLVRHGDLVFK